MPFVTNTVHLIAVPDGRRFVLDRPLEYVGRHETWIVPAGFVTDLASVPECMTWLQPRYGVHTRAAIAHDYFWSLARRGEMSKADADGVFRRVLRELGVSLPRRWLCWAAVRLASGLRGATAGDVARFLLVAVVALPFLLLPTLLVLIWQTVFRLVEL